MTRESIEFETLAMCLTPQEIESVLSYVQWMLIERCPLELRNKLAYDMINKVPGADNQVGNLFDFAVYALIAGTLTNHPALLKLRDKLSEEVWEDYDIGYEEERNKNGN